MKVEVRILPRENAKSAKMNSTPHPGPLLVRGGEGENPLRSLRSFAAIEPVCIGVDLWLKESHA